jgi:hypothetical protein
MVALPLAAALGACHAWSHQPVPAPESDRVSGGPVRPSRAGGAHIVLAGVTIDRDSLFERGPAASHGRVATGVRTEGRRLDRLTTVALVVAAAVAALLWMNLTHEDECLCAPQPH